MIRNIPLWVDIFKRRLWCFWVGHSWMPLDRKRDYCQVCGRIEAKQSAHYP